MADETTGQPAQVAPPAEAQATPPAPETQQAAPSPPTGGGMTLEQFASELNSIKSELGQARERAARAEHEAMMARTLLEQSNQGQARPVEAPPAEDIPEISDEEFLASPGKAFTKALRAMQSVSKADRERQSQYQYVERARGLFESAKTNVAPKAGKVIAGIEEPVALEIQNGIINRQIDPEAVNDPKLWKTVAIAYRINALGEDFDTLGKYIASGPQGMAPSYTERPTPGPPPKAGPTLTPEEEELVSRGNITREAYLASKEKIRQTAQERAR